jgi:hypothetical protein
MARVHHLDAWLAAPFDADLIAWPSQSTTEHIEGGTDIADSTGRSRRNPALALARPNHSVG